MFITSVVHRCLQCEIWQYLNELPSSSELYFLATTQWTVIANGATLQLKVVVTWGGNMQGLQGRILSPEGPTVEVMLLGEGSEPHIHQLWDLGNTVNSLSWIQGGAVAQIDFYHLCTIWPGNSYWWRQFSLCQLFLLSLKHYCHVKYHLRTNVWNQHKPCFKIFRLPP